MASKGNTSLNKGIPIILDAFVIIVKTEWNSEIVDQLEKGCKKFLKNAGIKSKTIVVPGAFELPWAIKNLAENSKIPVDAFIALATIIRGDTPHFDFVSKGITDGIMQLNLQLNMPTIFGVLTVDNLQQAQERIGGIHGHKGEEAATTAIKMINLKRTL